MTFILFFLPLFFGFVSPVYALNVTLQWAPNSGPNLAGYKVFSREEGQSYNYGNPYWELIDTTCTIYDLNETKTYCFVVRAFSTNGFESDDSNEVCLESTPVPVNKPSIADFDPDGDVDGSDLAELVVHPGLLDLSTFATEFGRTDCP